MFEIKKLICISDTSSHCVALFQRNSLVRPCNRFFRKKAPFLRFTCKNISANQRVRKSLGPRQCAMKVREACFRGTTSAEIMNSNSRSHSVLCSHKISFALTHTSLRTCLLTQVQTDFLSTSRDYHIARVCIP